MEVDVELLTCTKGVALGESDLRQRTITAVGAPNEVALDIEIVRLVEDAVQAQVEGVGIRTGRKLEVGTAEHTIGVDERGRFQMLLVAVLLTWTQTHVLEDDTGTDRGLIAVVMERQVTTLDGVVELLAHGPAELYVDVADIPLLEGFLGQAFSQLETELGLVLDGEGIGQIGGIARVIVIVAVVAEEVADTCALSIEGREAEGAIALDETFLAGGVDECLHRSGEVDVRHGVEPVEGVERDGVAYLALLRILLGHQLVSDVGTEVAVVLEHGTCDGGTKGGVHLTHQHRGLAKTLRHPLGEAGVLA